ncbi:MAG: hypothetical protein QXU81_00210 [Candidatus Bathyarchaeia archaeon]
MGKKGQLPKFVVIMILVLLLLIAHHYIIHNYPFDFNNVFSHEFLEALIIGMVIGILAARKR